MEKATYILNYFGRGVAVIIADNEDELKEKLKTAIQEEASAEKDGQFHLRMEEVGDYGEDTPMIANYVNDGAFIRDTEFTLVKTVSY